MFESLIVRGLLGVLNAIEHATSSSPNLISQQSKEDLDELAGECDDHSGIVGLYEGRIFLPRLIRVCGEQQAWRPGGLVLFQSGRGEIFSERTSEPGQYDSEAAWPPGVVSNAHNDPTPLLVGKEGFAATMISRNLIPVGFEPLQPSETALLFENLQNDFDGDGSTTWVSGASHRLSTIFVGSICDSGLAQLRQRCKDRRPW